MRSGHLACLQVILRCDFDAPSDDIDGMRALHKRGARAAIKTGRVDMLRALIFQGRRLELVAPLFRDRVDKYTESDGAEARAWTSLRRW